MTDWTLENRFGFSDGETGYRIMGDGPPLVMVHGTPFSSYVWRRIGVELAGSFRVHVFDLLGYGTASKFEGQDVSLGVQNKLLAALLDHWGLIEPYVIAHDFGGATALRAHLLDRRDYRKLLLIDPVAVRPWGSPFVQHVREYEEAFAGVPAYMHEAMVAAYLRGAVKRKMGDDELVPYVSPWLGDDGQPAFYRQIAQMDLKYTDEVEPLYKDVRCPVSILWGEDDEWIPAKRGKKLHGMIPGSRLHMVPAAGHLMQEDAPEAIIAEARRFFAD